MSSGGYTGDFTNSAFIAKLQNDLVLPKKDADNLFKISDIKFTQSKEYKINYDKIKTIEDIVLILKGLNITVYENYSHFEELKPYLKESE